MQVDRVIDTTYRITNPDCLRGNIRLRKRYRGRIAMHISASQVTRILDGLLSGTLHRAPANKRIAVSYSISTQRIHILITSANRKVPTSRLATIFRQFRQISNSHQSRDNKDKLNLAVTETVTISRNKDLATADPKPNKKAALILTLPH